VQLDNNLAALVLGETAGLELRVPMRWEIRATTVRAQMGVHNAYDLPLPWAFRCSYPSLGS
jgi:hypothetical protein